MIPCCQKIAVQRSPHPSLSGQSQTIPLLGRSYCMTKIVRNLLISMCGWSSDCRICTDLSQVACGQEWLKRYASPEIIVCGGCHASMQITRLILILQLHDTGEMLEEDSVEDSSDADDQEYPSGPALNKEPKARLNPILTSPDHVQQLWQVFIDNVDPLTKLVHTPSLSTAIQKAATNPKSVSRGFQALFYSICSAALMSLKDAACKQRFHQPRMTLLESYITATSTALLQANYMGTTSLIVLQALSLHILSVRDIFEPRKVWILNGIAIRIAEGMGLHRDGVILGLPPFETEIRRRLWWFLKMHDARATELCGLPKFREALTYVDRPDLPTNVNDLDIYPGMISSPPGSVRPTDMIFCAMRSELGSSIVPRDATGQNLSQQSNWWYESASSSDTVQKHDFIKTMEEMLESKYLRYCDPSKPLHLMTMVSARSVVNVGCFLAHHPRKWATQDHIPDSERKYVWDTSINLLEQHAMIQTNPLIQHFAWHVEYYLQWHSFIHVLDTLRTEPLMTDAEKAWQLVESTFENNPSMMSDMKRSIHVAVGNLCLKAFASREAAMASAQRELHQTPDFIVKLRQQRDAANQRREKRKSVSRNNDDGLPMKIDTTMNLSPGDGTGYETERDPSLQSYQKHGNHQIDAETFWLTGGTEEIMSNEPTSMMDMNAAFLQDQASHGEEPTKQLINWTQWDAWLSDSALAMSFDNAII